MRYTKTESFSETAKSLRECKIVFRPRLERIARAIWRHMAQINIHLETEFGLRMRNTWRYTRPKLVYFHVWVFFGKRTVLCWIQGPSLGRKNILCYNFFHMDPTKKVTRTFLRTEESMNRYMQISEERKRLGQKPTHFTDWHEGLIKEFTHWVIVTNEFPYDAIASTSHMISTKREVAFDWALLSPEELAEFDQIKRDYIRSNYDVLYENLPSGATISNHFHLHLLILRREEN